MLNERSGIRSQSTRGATQVIVYLHDLLHARRDQQRGRQPLLNRENDPFTRPDSDRSRSQLLRTDRHDSRTTSKQATSKEKESKSFLSLQRMKIKTQEDFSSWLTCYLDRFDRILHLEDTSFRAEAVHTPIVLIPCHKHGPLLSLSLSLVPLSLSSN